jgi:decaprenylphospho-beta-D-erythro-pentofuranosid-2-ulose 2-reductase
MKDAVGSVQSVLVLGAGSDIALATTRALVRQRANRVVLAARRPDELGDTVAELKGLGAETVEAVSFDANDTASHARFVDDLFKAHDDFDLVLVAFGVLGEQADAEQDSEAALSVIRTNFEGAVSCVIPIANRLKAQGHGNIVVLSTVAGERPRKSNFVYGSSKAGLDAFAQGLGDALLGTGVEVMVVRPGFVKTKMTTGLKPAPLSTTADDVASNIVEGLRKKSHTVWSPPALRYVMSVLRHLPRPVFRKLNM